ncbi:Uncharacterised protein [Mycobacteroides abscessus subsp. abscessus]|nr:Uncharacterised protein [Mycobacteroides abscessus subsp. abscessus]
MIDGAGQHVDLTGAAETLLARVGDMRQPLLDHIQRRAVGGDIQHRSARPQLHLEGMTIHHGRGGEALEMQLYRGHFEETPL